MRKRIAVLLVFALCLTLFLSFPAFAENVSLSEQKLSVDDIAIDCEKYNIDGSNYFKLRDLGKALDFFVGYDPAAGVTISGESGYTD